MKYEEAMKYITEVGNFGSNYGLERTYKLLEHLGNPERDLKLIHIAGTNGKGSTTSMITEILMGEGYKVGMYTSPFIEEFEERIQINRNNIPKESLAILMDEIKVAVDKVIEAGYNHPTEFEIITVLMLLYFKKENIDFGVIEVGLGGTLDSTNVIKPIIQVITSISFDHTNLLGNTLEKIAREKAGIIKKGIPTVIYPQQEEVLKVIKNKCFEMDSELYIANNENLKFENIVNLDKPYQLLKYNNEIDILLPLLGEHQIINLSVAMQAIEVLNNKNIIEFHKNNLLLLKSYDEESTNEVSDILNENRMEDQVHQYKEKVLNIVSNQRKKENKLSIIIKVFEKYKNMLNEEEINMFNGLIESYENQRIPFSTLEVVIKMYATRFKDKDILNQTFFYPYPENLINITDSGKGRKL